LTSHVINAPYYSQQSPENIPEDAWSAAKMGSVTAAAAGTPAVDNYTFPNDDNSDSV